MKQKGWNNLLHSFKTPPLIGYVYIIKGPLPDPEYLKTNQEPLQEVANKFIRIPHVWRSSPNDNSYL